VDALSGGRSEENGDAGQEEWHTVVLTGQRGVGKASIVSSLLRSDRTSMRDSFASDSSPLGTILAHFMYIICKYVLSNLKPQCRY